ncbi:hypothetical protein UCRNP2_8637 [Neofusicoccum parvum UCRNP2]|uniref:RING-type domain-containing protein n=1 Tax=Botryosphaeria parva (strain UCR-NP2) TaxID=1287680 RepID=R1EA32_BOTPV|nr:hypothetical protein UCRNP2_8637 [Neofusicoccum parvum UCRNP2]
MSELSFTLPAYTGATHGTRCPSCGQAYRDDSEPNIPILLHCGHTFCFTCLEAGFTSQLANAPHACRCPACAHLVYASLPHPQHVFWLRAEYHWEHAFMMVRVELSDDERSERSERSEPRPLPQPQQQPAGPPATGLRLAVPFHPAGASTASSAPAPATPVSGE